MNVPAAMKEFAKHPQMEELIEAFEQLKVKEINSLLQLCRTADLPAIRLQIGRVDGVEYSTNVLRELRKEDQSGE